MLRLAARRLLGAVPLLLAASILTFVLVANIGDPQKLEDLRLKPGVSERTIAQLESKYGLDQPVVTRYVKWIGNFITGDWGTDSNQVEVRADLWRALLVTLKLLLFAEIASVILGVLVGVVSAVRQYSAFDYVMTGLSFLFFSIPTFVLASLFKQFLAIEVNPWFREPSISITVSAVFVGLGILCGVGVVRTRHRYERRTPLNKMVVGGLVGAALVLAFVVVFKLGWEGNTYRQGDPSPLIPTTSESSEGLSGGWWVHFQDFFWHALLPSLTLITITFAGYSRFMRASMLETMNADFVRTARAKGLSERRVIVRHAFRNALMPLTTVVALDFGGLIGGAIITESIFGWSGMGRFFSDALAAKEPEPILAFVMVTAIAVVVFNLIADVLYARLDPRVRLD